MSHAASIHQPAILQPNTRSSALGWGISVLAHVFAVAWLWHLWLPHRADTDATPVTRIEVRLVPIARKVPLPPPARAHGTAIPQSTKTPARTPLRAVPVRRQAPVSVVGSAPTDMTQQPAADTASSTVADVQGVDLAAARAAARLIAHEDEKGLVALPKRKSVVDPNADHHVVDPLERARRIDCQTARSQSTNLLANVVMLAVDLAKNAVDDSGCKW